MPRSFRPREGVRRPWSVCPSLMIMSRLPRLCAKIGLARFGGGRGRKEGRSATATPTQERKEIKEGPFSGQRNLQCNQGASSASEGKRDGHKLEAKDAAADDDLLPRFRNSPLPSSSARSVVGSISLCSYRPKHLSLSLSLSLYGGVAFSDSKCIDSTRNRTDNRR